MNKHFELGAKVVCIKAYNGRQVGDIRLLTSKDCYGNWKYKKNDFMHIGYKFTDNWSVIFNTPSLHPKYAVDDLAIYKGATAPHPQRRIREVFIGYMFDNDSSLYREDEIFLYKEPEVLEQTMQQIYDKYGCIVKIKIGRAHV